MTLTLTFSIPSLDADSTLSLLETQFPVPKHPAQRQAHISALDRVTHDVYTLLAATKFYLNQRSPVSTLPKEILGRIFLQYAKATETLNSLKWTKLLLVSRTWYMVGIATPALWSHLAIIWDSKSKITRQLSRADNEPLFVLWEAYSETRWYPDILWTSYTHRFKSLTLAGRRTSVEKALQDIQPASMILLETLVVNVLELSDDSEDTDWKPMILPESFTTIPTLRTFHLIDAAFPWKWSRTLTEFIVYYTDNSTITTDIFKILTALSQLPLLRTIDFQVHKVTRLSRPFQTITNLSGLQKLKLDMPSHGCATLLQYIAVPMECSVRLELHHKLRHQDTLPLTDILATRHKAPMAIPGLSCLYIHDGSENAFTVGTRWDRSLGPGREHFVFRGKAASPYHRSRILQSVVQALPTHLITDLDVVGSSRLSEATWGKILTWMPLLDTIHLLLDNNSITAITFCNLSLKRLGVGGSGSSLPKIHRLKAIHIDSAFTFDADIDTPSPFAWQSEALIVLLERYMALNAPVHTVHTGRPYLFRLGDQFTLDQAGRVADSVTNFLRCGHRWIRGDPPPKRLSW